MNHAPYTATREAADTWCIRGSEHHPDESARGVLFAVVCEESEIGDALARLVKGERFRVADVAVRE